MNSNLQRALAASLLGLAGGSSAMAQFDYDVHCIDPNNTAPYSIPFIANGISNSLFGAGMGIEGTVAYKPCVTETNGATVPVRGRIGWSLGPTGSIQDDANPDIGFPFGGGSFKDDSMRFTWGYNDGFQGSGSGWSFARLFTTAADGTGAADTLFGANGFRLAYAGASNRYMYADTVNGTTFIRLEIDVLGDAARVSWLLRNNDTTARRLGLWYGAWTVLATSAPAPFLGSPLDNGNVGAYANERGVLQPYVTAPGKKPLTIERRYIRTDDPANFPDYVNFSSTQAAGYGLQVTNSPTASTSNELGQSDVTPVDEFVIGDVTFLLNGAAGGTTDPKFGDFIFPDNDFGLSCSYLQKWQPSTVEAGASREIVTYYRSASGDSNYTGGYSAVVDPPRVITTDPNDPTQFRHAGLETIRVYVDNTGVANDQGFGVVDRTVPMNNVQITLQLPAGIHAPGNPALRTLTGTIANISPRNVGFRDFAIEVDPELFGPQQYTVTINPTPGTVKRITGTINVASTPRLLIREGANLVTSPWSYSDTTWQTILSPLQVNQDYQAFTWDPVTQQYVVQTGPERGRGTWIVSTDDLSYKILQGSPTQPADEFPPSTGSALLQLKQGWNLVGNPYNYAIPLGQLVGVPSGTTSALTYQELVNNGLISGAFQYYDQSQRAYFPVAGADARLQANTGYWVFAQQDLTLSFPPVFELFARAPEANTFRQTPQQWRLQLSASTETVNDSQVYVGIAKSMSNARTFQAVKAPLAPTTDVVSASVSDPSGLWRGNFASLLQPRTGRQTFNYNVYTRKAGAVTVKWPNLEQIPTNLDVKVTDLATGKAINARRTAGYSFQAAADGTRNFKVEITPLGTIAQRIGTISVRQTSASPFRSADLNFQLASRGVANIRLLKNGVQVATIASDLDVDRGMNTIQWDTRLANGALAPAGSYTIEISARGEGGDVARRSYAVSLRK